jgi:hypothetical protein
LIGHSRNDQAGEERNQELSHPPMSKRDFSPKD